MSNEYTFGICKGCNKATVLKDGQCQKCNSINNVFEELFKGFIKEKPSGI